MSELINVTYYDLNNTLFKPGKSDREYVTVYTCKCQDKCDAYKNGKCVLLNFVGFGQHNCPHGNKNKIFGYTKSARHCGDLIRQYKVNHKDKCYALKEIKHVQKLSDYWYLNLPWLDCKHYITWKINDPKEIKDYQSSMSDFFEKNVVNTDLVHDDNFTVEFLNRLLDFKPISYFNNQLWVEFRNKYLPQFFYDLRKYYPEKYNEIKNIRPEVETYANQVTFKGKYAKLLTLNPGKVKVNTNILDWDGEKIISTSNVLSMWGKLNDAKVIIYPTENSVVEIFDDNTVNDNTEFV